MATKTHHDSEGINIVLDTNKISYYTDKILTYLNQPTAGVITQHDIYDLCTNMFSADIYLMNIFKKHPINTCYKFDHETSIKKFMSTVSDEMTWVVFLKYNIIICLNDPMISYIWPLRRILSETDNSFAPVNVIRLPYKCIFDNTEHIVIENNMVTVDEVTDTIQSVMRCLDLDDTLSTDVQTEIKKYVRKQQYIIDTHWDFVL